MKHLSQQDTFRFGGFYLDASDLLFRDGHRVALEPIQSRVLRALLHLNGRVATKSDLIEFAWHGRDVSDESIARAIYRLRKALGERREEYIEAVSGKGYRFVCPIKQFREQLILPVAEEAASQDLLLPEQTGSTAILKTVLALVNDYDAMLGYWDMSLRCTSANSAYEVWFGRSPARMLGITMPELLGPLFELNLPYIEGVKHGRPQHFKRSIVLPGGVTRSSLASYFPDLRDGRVQGFSVLVVDAQRFES